MLRLLLQKETAWNIEEGNGEDEGCPGAWTGLQGKGQWTP